jgi:hypothetical protein
VLEQQRYAARLPVGTGPQSLGDAVRGPIELTVGQAPASGLDCRPIRTSRGEPLEARGYGGLDLREIDRAEGDLAT